MLALVVNPLRLIVGAPFVCSLGLLLTVAGCTNQQHDSTIRFGLASAPINLDPRFATDAASSRINRLLYARLVDFDESFHPTPSLSRWEQRSPTHYRFYLQKHFRLFHNGARLTAQDVKATYQFILDPAHASPHRQTLRLITQIDTPTDDIVDFFLTRADSLFPSYLVIGILPGNLIQHHHPFQDHPVGSGPFTFLARPDDTRLQLKRRSDGQVFEFVHIQDPTVRTLKLLAGEIHMLQNDLPPEMISYLSQHKQIRLQRHRGSNFSYLGFNLQDPIVGRVEVRKAIAHAIDRERIIHFVLGGAAHLANALLPPEHWAGHPTLSGYTYDPKEARHLLQQAGFDKHHQISITYKTSSDPFRIRLATIIQSQLEQVGIHTLIQSLDWGTFYGDIKAGRFQMYSLAWVGIKTPDIFRYAFHSQSFPPHGANRGRFMSPMADTLIEQAEASQDLQRKKKWYQQLQAYLLATLPYVPLWFEDHVFVARQEIEGYTISPDGNFDGLLTTHWRQQGNRTLSHTHPMH